jgi:hypothetical protein
LFGELRSAFDLQSARENGGANQLFVGRLSDAKIVGQAVVAKV